MARFEIYQARDGWRWRLWSTNSRIVADSGEAYATEYNAVRAAKRTKEIAPTAVVLRSDGTVLSEEKHIYINDPF